MEIQTPYEIIASGSDGNSVLLFGSILIDVGVPFSSIKNIVNNLQLITWSHGHNDHFNRKTIEKLIALRPTIRVAVCEHERERAIECGAKNLDILEHGKWYDYGSFQIATFKTYHDIPSNGYRVKNDSFKVFFATDTCMLHGIEAKDYTHYLCESNYDSDTIFDRIKAKEIIRLHESKSF
jgi:L-ascorbate metabolism protein UlaG (beta-lactamase superfamily)